MEFTFRPTGNDWPHEKKSRPKRSVFKAGHSQTIELLEKELSFLGARKAVIQIDLRERDIRLDGLPRANAPEPTFSGVILAFESKYGPLKYATDVFDRWKDNLRAIALGLEALRKVDRYGVTKRGEQYTGWKQLPQTASESSSVVCDIPSAAAFLARHSNLDAQAIRQSRERFIDAYRDAARKCHPDKGGNMLLFNLLQKAKDILNNHHGD